ATGARARTLPSIPIDGERVITYRHALELKTCPQKLLVVGSGAIGIEFAYFYAAFGAEVTVVEVLDNILPLEDAEISKTLEKTFKKSGMTIRTKALVESIQRKGQNVHAIMKVDGKVEEWSGDYCLVAIGVQGNVENLGLETVGIQPERSFVPVD